MSRPVDKYGKLGDAAFSRMEKVNADLFLLTYGSLVTQLLKDMEDAEAVNAQLDKMGYNIGLRLIDEFLAKSGVTACQDFRETAEVVAKVGLRMFLGVGAEVVMWNKEMTACSLVLAENPLAEYVELPANLVNKLWYSNLLCGVIRGCLEQLQLRVECRFEKDALQGDDQTMIRLELKEVLHEEYDDDD
ncbi:trappc3 [Symbiodinium natans]|uniref:Trafficking protein particle complex subunit n=1 Tax=Symbiodinium natans TaxID=878477 RepID=A0A812UHR0_9DINO|nr:trappc3 [Symbiodinium natans]